MLGPIRRVGNLLRELARYRENSFIKIKTQDGQQYIIKNEKKKYNKNSSEKYNKIDIPVICINILIVYNIIYNK